MIPGIVNGWMFEFRDKKGNINYNSTSYHWGTPEDYCDSWLQYGEDALFEMERWNGYEPTGRVVFRGYATEHYDVDEHDWYVEPYEPVDDDFEGVG